MNFSELDLHPAVADALAARGYDTATPVQTAVLNPENATRDLLVSSQTGSGKTIAFGISLANTLLGPEAPPREQRTAPIALVVVPTRELAVQVRQELGWLLEKTGLRLASFTGGTAVTGDLRVLQRGLDVIIGTPGRLVDLLRRQRLELAHIRVVVLDEADEMLDLGFREDLQTLLQAAAPTRRTLLLSATLPPEIQALAKRFQRDALRIDPRKDGDPAARQSHGDITFVAHLISGPDRLAVVVNVLRAAGDGRAIVFCTTREGVSRLHTALVGRGFAATAISGDRAQAERDRALEQVRRGDAQILVATNVAARGLHLPDVDLIIHADLPLNAESLTHRSGRTGRAGRKGTAVVIAGLSERRKAERLLSMAHVNVPWTAPPSADAITAAARERLIEELLAAAPADQAPKQAPVGAPPGDPTASGLVERLEQTLPAGELARRLLLRELARLPVGERVHAVAVPGPGSGRRDQFDDSRRDNGRSAGGARPRSRDEFSREGVLFRVNIGAKENAEARWLLPLICRRGGVTGSEVGSIRIGPSETLFEIAGDAAADYARAASEPDPRAPHVRIERARPAGPGGPGSPRGSAEPRRSQNHAAPRSPSAPNRPPRTSPETATTARPAAPARAAVPAATAPPTPRPAPPARAAVPATAAPHTARPAAPARTSVPATAAPHTARPTAPARAPVPATAAPPRLEFRAPPPAAHASRRPEGTSIEHPTTRAGRSKAPAPVVEMKVAHRPPATSPRGTFRSNSPTDETKRPHPTGFTSERGRPQRHDAPSAGTHTDRPHTDRPRTDRPRTDRGKMDGTNPVKRSFGSSQPSASPQPSPPAPFWKSGARQRPSAPPRRHDGPAKKNNSPIR